MNTEAKNKNNSLPTGVMFNTYPDSIGRNLSDTVDMLKRSEFKDVFSLFYILPTFFNSDLDRGFSIIDYDLNGELVSKEDLEELDKLGIMFKFDLVLNHLSVGSPQFQDMLEHGDESEYKDFFIDWNDFWRAHGEMGPDGYIIPYDEYLENLFMRKPGLPILKVRFPDGSDRPYWNTFYQEITYNEISPSDLLQESQYNGLSHEDAVKIADIVNHALREKADIFEIDLGKFNHFKDYIVPLIERNRKYLGQMDLNAKSEKVWDFYDETLKKLRDHGGKMIRLDAFAYLHKEIGMANFFNKPGTWDYLERLKKIAARHDLILLPEIHSEYGNELHAEVASEGFPIYDFFFPGLVIDALDRGSNRHLLRWIGEILDNGFRTVNMLGCHDGIPVLDLKAGKDIHGTPRAGLLSDEEIEAAMERIMDRGGRVKSLYGPDGKKISYYQINATFFSALGEDERKLLLARAIQMFMPGIPQVWYLDIFAGKNDYAAADKGGAAGHKEINRTTLSNGDIEQGLKRIVVRDQLKIMRFRNTSPAFGGQLAIHDAEEHILNLTWENEGHTATLMANLRELTFNITLKNDGDEEGTMLCR
uniref:Sucrose phosphorylase n=1 Tax=Candidatus Kentrum sp. LPFa TaxID=2126335 RepID=A0A450XV13_9GAMM|nr:MAG: sucrose phosphorylase [Candidatus Kentron sp. LPFa]VFK33113.1 MAG: sucrose phosphorylase [Candidatus Kentron sp. LPFa]